MILATLVLCLAPQCDLDTVIIQEAFQTGAHEFNGVGTPWNPWAEWDTNQWMSGVGSMSQGAPYGQQPFGGWWQHLPTFAHAAIQESGVVLTPEQQAIFMEEAKASGEFMFEQTLGSVVDQCAANWETGFLVTLGALETFKENHASTGNCDAFRSSVRSQFEWWVWYSGKLGWTDGNLRFRVVDLLGNPDDTVWGFWARDLAEAWFWQLENYWPEWASQQ